MLGEERSGESRSSRVSSKLLRAGDAVELFNDPKIDVCGDGGVAAGAGGGCVLGLDSPLTTAA